ncbi:hypothetical protein NHX12_006706 [Muraenolepis orangiensis]|uniref:CUE domain-containing protein n=1 Tax=Muraenolepis orangiensis TaxID=630683 RepID=A0A9Q0DQ74_9TELE|nr:hypothetical protein NHX12_006706 [Muraenolepis orangiensis]
MMEPDQNQGAHLDGRRDTGGVNNNNNNKLPETNTVESPDASGNSQQTNFPGFTMIPPHEARRRQVLMVAQRGEEDLQKLKESRKAAPIDEPPERLGGRGSLDEARRKQQAQLGQARLQKRLQKKDLDMRSRTEEQEENQRMKDEQREKAKQLEENTKQRAQRRSQALREDHVRATETFLQNLQHQDSLPASLPRGGEERERWRGAESSGLHLKKRQQTLPVPQGQTLQDDPREREMGSGREQADHKMPLNSAFLDGLVGRPVTHVAKDPPQDRARWPESPKEPKPDAELELVVTNLELLFPECSRRFLEDIVLQCDGDAEQASDLLSQTLS